MDFLKKLKLPDYLSLTSLLFAWLSILAIIKNSPNFSILLMLLAFSFDFLDGYFARRLKLDSKKGRILDSFVDIFTYSLYSSLFFIFYLSPNYLTGVIMGFLIILFGVLRLVRYTDEGILEDGKGKYYRGVTVLHINVVIFLGYFIKSLTGIWNSFIFSLFLVILTPFMLSEYKTYKTENYYLIFSLVILFAFLALYFEYAY